MKTIEFQTNIENGIITVPKQFGIPNQLVKIAIFEKDLAEKEILHLEIDNQLKHFFSVSVIQNYLEQQLKFLLIEQIKSNIDKKFSEQGIDNELLLEKARVQAWDIYQDYFLKDVNVG